MLKLIVLQTRVQNSFSKAAILLCVMGVYTFSYGQQPTSRLLSTTEYCLQAKSIESANVSFSNAKNVQSLLTHHAEAIYISGQEIKTYGTHPKMILLSLSDISQLGSTELAANHIELIQFTISATDDLNTSVDFQLLARFKNLKYLHFSIQNEQQVPQLNARLANENVPYTFLYSIHPTDRDY